MPSSFDLRIVRYTPGGARVGVIPTLTINANPVTGDNAAASFTCSQVVYETLPDFLEFAVEYWNGTGWVEGDNCRYVATTTRRDDRDPADVRTVSGPLLWWWLLGKNNLGGTAPYSESGLGVTADPPVSNTSTSGTTVTKTAHGFIDGDSFVVVTLPAGMKALKTGRVRYYVVSATANTFKIAGTRGGAPKTLGTYSGLDLRRVHDKIASPNSGFRDHDKVVFTNVDISETLETGRAYYIVERNSTSYGVAEQVGGFPVDIPAGVGLDINNLALYRDTEGKRDFSGVTPGQLLRTVVDEAQTRGWGSYLSYDFAISTDSAGAAWDTSTSLQFDPGTTGAQILRTLLDMGLCEFRTTGRVLHLFNPEYGTERGIGNAPTRLGGAASELPVNTDLNSLLTTLTVKGEGNLLIELANLSAPDDLGRLEGHETLSGITDEASATILGNRSLTEASRVRKQYQVTEHVSAAAVLPMAGYQLGDWVQARISGVWQRVRVVEFVLSKDGNGVTVTAVLNDRFTELIVKYMRRQAAGSGGAIVGGTGSSGGGTGANDTRKPATPSGLVVSSLASWGRDGQPVASLQAFWSPVTAATDGTALDVDLYELWARQDGEADSERLGSTTQASITQGPVRTQTEYYVKVRARSGSGQWGPFTDEVEVTTVVPVEPLDTPDAPTVTSKLGTVRVSWNGLLDGNTPPAHFAYTYTMMSDAEAGVYIPVGQNLGHAGSNVVAGLSLGDVRWFKLYAVDRLDIESQPSAAVSVTVVGVSGPDIEANSLTANHVEAGSGFFEILSLGAPSSRGTPIDRVPTPATDVAWWSGPGASVFGETQPGERVTPTTSGLSFSRTSTLRAITGVTALHAAPMSGKIAISWIADTSALLARVREVDAVGTSTYRTAPTTSGAIHTLLTSTVRYGVFFELPASASAPSTALLSTATVFEVIGATSGDQWAELSPSGLRLGTADGTGLVELTTNTDNFLSIQKWTGVGYEPQAVIDADGNGVLTGLTVGDDITVRGTPLVGGFEDIYRNGSPDDVPIVERGARGGIRMGYFSLPDFTTSVPFRAVAYLSFEVVSGRQYRIAVDAPVLTRNDGTGIFTAETIVSPNPINVTATTGYTELRRLDIGSGRIYPDVFSFVRTMRTDPTLSTDVTLKTGINYLLVRFRNPDSSSTLLVSSVARGMVAVEDIGPAYSDLDDVSNSTTSGTSTAPSVSQTQTWNCSWSASWRESGSAKVTGSGQYTDADMLYQGYGASPMGARFGFPALGISGKTISRCEIWLKNRYTYYASGVTALLGTGTATSEPATFGTRTDAWSKQFDRGEGKWIPVPSSLWPSIASGTIRNFSLGVSGSSADYAYFDGNTKSSEPKLRITYK